MSEDLVYLDNHARELAGHLATMQNELGRELVRNLSDEHGELYRRRWDGRRYVRVTPPHSLQMAIEQLDKALTEADFDPGPSLHDAGVPLGMGLPLGWVRIVLEPRKIHGGFLQPTLNLPVVVPSSDRVIAFLITLSGEDDYLFREHKGTLWHYHYLNSAEVRSDVILCWDTRQRINLTAKPPEVRALFQEKHGEGKSHFKARPDLWRDRKKQTMHRAIVGDLNRWPIAEFRCASNRAGPVWPVAAKLTPKPVIAKPASKHPAKKGKARR